MLGISHAPAPLFIIATERCRAPGTESKTIMVGTGSTSAWASESRIRVHAKPSRNGDTWAFVYRRRRGASSRGNPQCMPRAEWHARSPASKVENKRKLLALHRTLKYSIVVTFAVTR